MIDGSYKEYVDVVKHAKDQGLVCVLVYKPDARDDDGSGSSIPDMIISTTEEPNVIAAMLGNYPLASTPEFESDTEETL